MARGANAGNAGADNEHVEMGGGLSSSGFGHGVWSGRQLLKGGLNVQISSTSSSVREREQQIMIILFSAFSSSVRMKSR